MKTKQKNQKNKTRKNKVWFWCMPVTLVLGRLKWENHEFIASLDQETLPQKSSKENKYNNKGR